MKSDQYLPGKQTFTGEEMVEINCHGGVYITSTSFGSMYKNRVLEWQNVVSLVKSFF